MKTVLVLQTFCVLAVGYLGTGEKVKPLVMLSGCDSKATKEAYLRIDTKEHWAKTWAAHAGAGDDAQRPMMEVDFSSCMVVAIFRGECSQVRQVQIDSVKEGRDRLIVYFHDVRDSKRAAGRDTVSETKQPYAFIMLPKSDKSVSFVQGERRYADDPLEWGHVIRMDADGSRHDIGGGDSRGPVRSLEEECAMAAP